MAKKREELSEAEQEVLKALWELGAGTVREVCEALNRDGRRRVYTTVLTFLARLESKGYVASDKQDVAHVFRPIVSREALLSQRLTRLVDEVCEGTAAPVVQALVRGGHLRATISPSSAACSTTWINKPSRRGRSMAHPKRGVNARSKAVEIRRRQEDISCPGGSSKTR